MSALETLLAGAVAEIDAVLEEDAQRLPGEVTRQEYMREKRISYSCALARLERGVAEGRLTRRVIRLNNRSVVVYRVKAETVDARADARRR
jgi:hypothetical protein